MKITRLLSIAGLAVVAVQGMAVDWAFGGLDAATGPADPRPNSNAMAAAFDTIAADINPIRSITMERLALQGPVGAIALNNEVVATAVNGSLEILNVDDTILGWNTTVFGSKHLRFTPNFNAGVQGVLLTFLNPINAVGMYINGLEDRFSGPDITLFAAQPIIVGVGVNKPAQAGVAFLGLATDAGMYNQAFIAQNAADGNTRDIIGIDDIRYTACAVPEPGTIAAIGLGVVALIGRRRKA